MVVGGGGGGLRIARGEIELEKFLVSNARASPSVSMARRILARGTSEDFLGSFAYLKYWEHSF